ncbi:MAG: M48 family metallopeptidase [Jhaorihella sp.]
MRRLIALLALALTACDVAGPSRVAPPVGEALPLEAGAAAKAFVEVVAAVEPVAGRECRRLAPKGTRCDFLIAVNRDLRAPPNAFQSRTEAGQPVVTFTVAMIAQATNADEMAFVLGHEAAHHILGHLARQAEYAAAGAAIFAGLAGATGASPADIAEAEQIGAIVGARRYSKEFELEADRLGTAISLRAGYDPVLGAAYFARIPDPGNRFLGSHPPNAERMGVVTDTARRLGAGG